MCTVMTCLNVNLFDLRGEINTLNIKPYLVKEAAQLSFTT